MHHEAMRYIDKEVQLFLDCWRAPADQSPRFIQVLEIGSRDINGSPRECFTASRHPIRYTGLDIAPGPGVDVVADGATWDGLVRFDLVICAEVLEHASNWRGIIANASKLLSPGGEFIGTAAGEGRQPHSAVDGEHLTVWNNASTVFLPVGSEFYENITYHPLTDALAASGFKYYSVEHDKWHGDIYWHAEK